LREEGLDAKRLKLDPVVRVKSAARHFEPKELQALLEPAVSAALPPGVSLTELKVLRGISSSPRIRVGSIHLPTLPRRVGALTLTCIADLTQDDDVVFRLPVTLTVDVSQEAAAPLVARGAEVSLVIARGSARISTTGIALENSDRGQLASFKVAISQKVLRARVESKTLAVVVAQ
jgi:hypothetical protein